MCFPGSAVLKNLPANAGDSGDTRDMSSIPGLGRSSGEGNGYPLQYSCLEYFMERGVWQAAVHGVTKSWTWLSAHTHTHIFTDQCWFFFSCRKKKYFHSLLFLRFLSPAVRLAFLQGQRPRGLPSPAFHPMDEKTQPSGFCPPASTDVAQQQKLPRWVLPASIDDTRQDWAGTPAAQKSDKEKSSIAKALKTKLSLKLHLTKQARNLPIKSTL